MAGILNLCGTMLLEHGADQLEDHSNHLASMCIGLIIISKQVRWREKVVTLVDNLNHQVEDRLEL